MYDLVIRNGTIVDGTGRARFVGDVAIRDGLLVQVGGTVNGDATETIDATGRIVTPGFVDVHTHFDGQVTWDDLLEPSASHGVTTVVAGNCGVGFAPCQPERRDQLVQLMEGVEDIPGTALTEGMTWDWTTFPDYLDALSTRRWSMDVGTQITHGALRVWVMGDRAIGDVDATRDEVEQMAALVGEAIELGALGFSTSRTFSHKAPDGNYVPGTYADADELWPIAAAVAEAGPGVFQLAPQGTTSQDPEEVLKELDWMRRLSLEFGLTVSPVLAQIPTNPGLYREVLDACLAARADGAMVVPQVSAKSQGLLVGLTTSHAFQRRPTFVALAERSDGDLAALVAELRRPEVKAAILAEDDLPLTGALFEGVAAFAQNATAMLFPVDDQVDQEPGAGTQRGGTGHRRRTRAPRVQLRPHVGAGGARSSSRPASTTTPTPGSTGCTTCSPTLPPCSACQRRRRPLRHARRRVDAHHAAHPLGARPHPRPADHPRSGRAHADLRDGRALRPRRPRRAGRGHARRPQRDRPRSTCACSRPRWSTTSPQAVDASCNRLGATTPRSWPVPSPGVTTPTPASARGGSSAAPAETPFVPARSPSPPKT